MIICEQSEKRFLTLSEPSLQHRRCFAEELGTSASIGDGSPNHQRYYHIEYVSPMFTRASSMCRRSVWDILNLGVHRRMFADCSALFGDISPMVIWRRNIGRKFQCIYIELFLDVPMPWRSMAITRVRRRTTGVGL